MKTFDGDNVIAKLMEIVNSVVVYVCLYIYIYIHNLPAIDRLGSWCF